MHKPSNSSKMRWVFFVLLSLIIVYACTKRKTSPFIPTDYANIDSLSKIDSLRKADSLSKIKFFADSVLAKQVADSIANAQRVADSLLNGARVADSLANVQRIADSTANAKRITDSLTNITRIADSIANVKRISDSTANAKRIADSLANVRRIADSTANAKRIADSIYNVKRIADSTANAKRITDSLANVRRIADSTANAKRIADSLANVKRIADSTAAAQNGGTTGPSIDEIIGGIISNSRVFDVGLGMGDLTINGTNFTYNGAKVTFQNGDIIKIRGGSYNSITITNLAVPSGQLIKVINNGQVTFDGSYKTMALSNLKNVMITGEGTPGVDKGFAFQNNSYRSIILSGNLSNLTIKNMSFKNIADYVINYQGLDKKVYNGSEDSYLKDLAFLNLYCENTGSFIQLGLGASIENGVNTGFINGLEIAGVTCVNSSTIGAVAFVGNVANYRIHDNYVNNINTQSNIHNGIFQINGWGKFYNNTVTNHQGNAIRAWAYSLDGTGTVEIFNNVVYNSRKYSAFELQSPQYISSSSLFKPANAKVYNNTVGRLNTEQSSFPGRVLDLYNIYGTLEIYNNLAFSNNDNLILNNMSDTKIIKNTNNIYKANATDAVVDLVKFISKVAGTGAGF